jgi:methyltransferase (TIGR00027 family)
MAKRTPAAQTAFGPMLIVAVEQAYPSLQRVVQDNLAIRFLPAGTDLLVSACRWRFMRNLLITLSEQRAPGVWGGVLCRKRYADDRVAQAVTDRVEQMVILGAGLDTRAYRLVAPAGVPAFEIDVPANIVYKEQRLRRIYGRLPEHVALVAVDFGVDDLGVALGAHGFRLEQRAMFVCEAVTQYLTEDAVRRTLAFLSHAASGSRLIFTYVRKDFLDGTNQNGAQGLYRDFVAKRVWRFGIDPEHVGGLLQEYGWAEREQVGRAEYAARYLEPIGRDLSVSEMERFVYAEKV